MTAAVRPAATASTSGGSRAKPTATLSARSVNTRVKASNAHSLGRPLCSPRRRSPRTPSSGAAASAGSLGMPSRMVSPASRSARSSGRTRTQTVMDASAMATDGENVGPSEAPCATMT
jgi:hypothetical protein